MSIKSQIQDLESYQAEIRVKIDESVALTGKHSDRSKILQREYDSNERRIRALVVSTMR